MLLYALYSDSDLDAKKIYHSLSTNPELEKNAMSVAEKLKAEGRVAGRVAGRVEGQEKGLWIGKIQAFEEFLDLPMSSDQTLGALNLEELKAMQERLRHEYELRFKRN